MVRIGRSGLRTSLLLLASSGCPVFADERFIVQPKLRSQAEAATATSATSLTETTTSPGEGVLILSPSVEAPPVTQRVSPAELRDTNQLSTAPVNDGLHWVSRGAEKQLAGTERASVGQPWHSGDERGKPTRPLNIQGATVQAQAALATTTPVATQANEEREERKVLASMVSRRIIGGMTPIESSGIEPVDGAPGWQAIGERLAHHLKESESLLRRHAILSSRQEAEAAAVYLARTLDLAANRYQAEPHMRAAEQAFREARDFYRQQSSDPQALRRIVDSHQTPVLKAVDLTTVSPLVAAQHYRQCAYENLLAACQDHPWASEVLCSLGRTYQAEAEGEGNPNDEKRSRAATYYRAAVAISPNNTLAANQLGFLLLRMDRPQEAIPTLLGALRIHPFEPALENLVEASRRLGETKIHSWAMEQLIALRSTRPARVTEPAVTEVDVQTFAALSPYGSGPKMTPSPAGVHASTAAPPGNYR